MKTIAIVVPLILIIAGATWAGTSRHVWFRCSRVEVLRDGAPEPSARVYQTKEGTFFIDISSAGEWYSVTQDGQSVGYCDRARGGPLFGVAYIARDDCLPCVGYNAVKVTDAHIVCTAGRVEFDSRRGGRLQVVLAGDAP